MNKKRAELLARALGPDAESWHSGGETWLVLLRKGDDGKVIVFSDESVTEYANETDFRAGHAANSIDLIDVDNPPEEYVIVDAAGTIFYADDELGLGWPSENDARREALSLWSRGEGKWQVVDSQELASRKNSE